MTVSYSDIVMAMKRVAKDGRTIDYAVITEDTKDEFVENMVVADDTDAAFDQNDDSIGTAMEFDVQIGTEHKIVTTDGTTYPIA